MLILGIKNKGGKEMKKIVILVCLICLVMGFLKGVPLESSKMKKIGVSLLKRDDDFYRNLEKGLKEAAKKYKYEIIILSADSDEMKQQQNIDALITKKVDAIVICPVNSKGVGSIIKKATDKKIPVFTADIAAQEGKVIAHIASDNYMGGKLAGERMIKEIGSGKVAIIYQPATESVESRVKGFVDTAKKGGLEIIEPYYNGKDDMQVSESVAKNAIRSNPSLKGIFAANDTMAQGAEMAIKDSGKNIILIGYDAAPVAIEKIKAGGPWKADVIQYPINIGTETVRTIDKYFKGKIKPQKKTIIIPVPVGIVDKNTLK